MHPDTAQITKMLSQVRAGNPAAADQLMQAVYHNLKGLARNFFASERPDHTMQPTALVNEAYLRIFFGAEVTWQDRSHFYAVAARQMRRILTDHGREFRAAKRGNGLKVVFDDAICAPVNSGCEFSEIEQLLERLQRIDPEAANVVEMKFFAGMTDDEVAQAMGVSHSSVRRHWAFAKAWLVQQMSKPKSAQVASAI